MGDVKKPAETTDKPAFAGDLQPPESNVSDVASSGLLPGELPAEDWEKSGQLGWSEASSQEMLVYAATVRRVERMSLAIGAIFACAAGWPLGWALAVGVLMGTLLGAINFRWLAHSVNAIGERIVKGKTGEQGLSVVMRGVGRIFLITVFAYVIFTCSLRGLLGYLAGLAVPVIALMCEAVYEFVAGNRRSF